MTLLRLPTLCRMSTTALLRKGGSSCYCTGVSPGLSVIVSHPEFIAINKPPGLPFHSRDDAQGVIPTIRRLEASGALPQQGPLYPLHRLNSHPDQCTIKLSSYH